jgi:hypothetical protein
VIDPYLRIDRADDRLRGDARPAAQQESGHYGSAEGACANSLDVFVLCRERDRACPRRS